MLQEPKKKSKLLKLLLCVAIVGVIAGGSYAWYVYNDSFTDMSKRESAITINAMDLLNEFQKSDSTANQKYAEKIITVKGIVSELESADTTINLKMVDTLTDAYIIFSFQNENLNEVKKLKEGDNVSIKGSCSGGAYSDILETEFVTFKRCIINK